MSAALVEAFQRRLRSLENRLQSAHLVGIGAGLRNDFALDGGKIDPEDASVAHDLAPCNMHRFDVACGRAGQDDLKGLDHSVDDVIGELIVVQHENISGRARRDHAIPGTAVHREISVPVPPLDRKSVV